MAEWAVVISLDEGTDAPTLVVRTPVVVIHAGRGREPHIRLAAAEALTWFMESVGQDREVLIERFKEATEDAVSERLDEAEKFVKDSLASRLLPRRSFLWNRG